MKKYILVLLILLLSTLCYAAIDTFEGETITDANNIEGCTTCDTIDGQVKKAAGCTASTPGNDNSEIGYITVGASSTALTGSRMYAWLYAADCTGDLGTAYVYLSNAAGSGDVKVAVYSTTDTDTESIPTNGTRIGYTGEIAMDAVAGWDNGAMSGGSVVATTKYWLAVFTPNETGDTLYHDSSGRERHYVQLEPTGGDYTSIPATIPLAGGCTADDTPWTCCTGEGTGCTWSSLAAREMSVFVGIQ